MCKHCFNILPGYNFTINLCYLNYRIWDYQSGSRICQWKPDLRIHKLDLSYRSPPHLSAAKLINSHDIPLVVAGFNDGNIQVWSKCFDGRPKLVSGWHALPICKSPSFESSSSKHHSIIISNQNTYTLWYFVF